MKRLIYLVLAFLLMGTAPPPSAKDQHAINAFLTNVYASYRQCHGDLHDCAAPIPPSRIFTPGTVRLIELNKRLNKGYAGAATDSDPICQCQDFESISVLSITLHAWREGKVLAKVRQRNFGVREVSLIMEKTVHGWRVHDVVKAPEPGYRQRILAENRQLQKGLVN